VVHIHQQGATSTVCGIPLEDIAATEHPIHASVIAEDHFLADCSACKAAV
jgi:hypothetical protein